MKKNLSRVIITVVLILLSLYFLYPTYKDYVISKDLSKLSGQDSVDYLDKNAEQIRKSRENRIKLGLDLKGGMYVIMDVDVVKLLDDLAKNKDDVFNGIINETRDQTRNTDEPILNVVKGKLKSKGLNLKTYYGEIRDDEATVEKNLNSEIDNSIDRAVEVIRNRIDQYGVAEPQIQKIGGNRIIVELPGVSNQIEVRKLLQGTALLEFKIVADPEYAFKIMKRINDQLAGKSLTDSIKTDTTKKELSLDSINKNQTSITSTKEGASKKDTSGNTTKKDSSSNKKSAQNKTNQKDTSKKKSDSVNKKDTSKLTNIDSSTADSNKQLSEEEFKQKNPFFYLARPNPEGGTADLYVREQDKPAVERIIHRDDIRSLIPSDIQFAWSNRSFESAGEKIFILYTLKREAELTGKVIVNARSNIDPVHNTPVVTMEMNDEGSADWARITGANINKRCAIVLDSVIYSAPVIRSKITGGNSQIEGMGSVQEAKLLEIILKAGALPAPLKIIEERTIGPSLGEDSIRAGVTASVAALLLVAIFMLLYYRVGGSVADLALLINVLFILGIMASLKATLTLPGIAGLILSLGMAVDSNVLIYERIREEFAAGKPLRTTIDIGYKKAFSAILDSHVTSLITGLILYQFGTGPIQGFALTLMFGLVANLFTSIVITHFIFDYIVDKGKTPSFG